MIESRELKVNSLSSLATSASVVRMKNWYSSKGEVRSGLSHTAFPADLPNFSPVSVVTSGRVSPAQVVGETF